MSLNLYPAIEPFQTHRLDVGDGHTIFVEESGAKSGLPVVVLHGGPGNGASAETRRLFDPGLFRVIQFDQRGALRSTPLGGLDANTTAHLVSDTIRVREYLGLDRWLVLGGSWGSALALAYAAQDAPAIAGQVLRGIYLGRRSEDLWQYQHGASELLPEAWNAFLEPIPAEERGDLVAAYYKRLTDDSQTVRRAAARAFLLWGLRTNNFMPDPEGEAVIEADYAAPFVEASARIAAHYAINRSFLPADGYLLEVAASLNGLPTSIIHGRYDLAIPLSSAAALKQAMPSANFRVVEAAGHAPLQPEMAEAVMVAIASMAAKF